MKSTLPTITGRPKAHTSSLDSLPNPSIHVGDGNNTKAMRTSEEKQGTHDQPVAQPGDEPPAVLEEKKDDVKASDSAAAREDTPITKVMLEKILGGQRFTTHQERKSELERVIPSHFSLLVVDSFWEVNGGLNVSVTTCLVRFSGGKSVFDSRSKF